jgi:hypothetical protein
MRDAVRAGDWWITNNRIRELLTRNKTFEEYFKYAKGSGHGGSVKK